MRLKKIAINLMFLMSILLSLIIFYHNSLALLTSSTHILSFSIFLGIEGMLYFRYLIDILKPGGVGALHFTYKCSSTQRILNTFPITYIFYSLYKGNPIKDRPMRMM